MRKKVSALLLALALLFSLTAPAFAAGNGVAAAPGHEVLAGLPAAPQRPVRPATLEQAEGRVNVRYMPLWYEAEKRAEFIREYGDWYTAEELERELKECFTGGIYPCAWPLPQSKESVFQEIVALTDSLTAGKTTDTEKIRAIYGWVAENVKYDWTSYQYWCWQEAGYRLTGEQEDRCGQASDPFCVYANRLGICGGYASLCWLMGSIAEIPVASIGGESNDRAYGGKGGPHGWNAAFADGRWIFFDATWSEWDMAPDYHNKSEGIAFCDGVFQESIYLDKWDNSFPVSYWLCPGFVCPASVTIPEGVFQVMAESFKNCTTLKSITLPSTCTAVETEAFMGCTGLESIVIPAGVKYVHWRSFKNCASLKNVTFQGRTEVREGAFDGTPMVENAEKFAIVGNVLVKFNGKYDAEAVIPAGVTAIAEKAFVTNLWIRRVVIPEGVVSIGDAAFRQCTSLTDVTIPGSVTSIGWNAFRYTPWLEKQGDFPIFNGILLDYQGPKDVTSVTVPDGVREIAAGAFYSNGSNIRSITFPASLKKIGSNMLSHSYLEEVVFKGTREQWDAVEILRNGCTNWVMRNDDGAGPEDGATIRCTGAYAASPTNDRLTVDGTAATPTAYKIDGANYFKLRDVAALLNGSASQFNVEYDAAAKSIVITTGKGYEIQGADLQPTPGGTKPATTSNNAIYIDGVKAELTIYKIDGANYFKLRDLGQALDFYVGWKAGQGVFIETDKPYDPAS